MNPFSQQNWQNAKDLEIDGCDPQNQNVTGKKLNEINLFKMIN